LFIPSGPIPVSSNSSNSGSDSNGSSSAGGNGGNGDNNNCFQDPPIVFARNLSRVSIAFGGAVTDFGVNLISIGAVGAAAGAPFASFGAAPGLSVVGLGLGVTVVGSGFATAGSLGLAATDDVRAGILGLFEAAGEENS